MKLIIQPSRIRGKIDVPGSKSHTVRGIAAALLAEGVSILRSPLVSDDTLHVLHAAEKLGAVVQIRNGEWQIRGTGGKIAVPDDVVFLGNSGTGLRILTALASLACGTISFDGDSSLRSRIMTGELASLVEAGAKCISKNGFAPLSVTGPLRGGTIHADGTTSQFLTALLMSLPLAEKDSEITLDFLNEKPYVRITLDWLKQCGIRIDASEDGLHYTVPGRQRFSPFKRTIPADFSTAAFPLAAGLIAGDGIEISTLDFQDPQGDKAVFSMLRKAEGDITDIPGGVRVRASRLKGMTFDLNETPDALPVMAVLGAYAEGETRLINVPQARLKETDRIRVMAENLAAMGADVRELPDGLVIRGGKKLHGTVLSGCGDHRIVMSLACAALGAEGESVITGAEAFSVTWPEFSGSFRNTGADFVMKEE